ACSGCRACGADGLCSDVPAGGDPHAFCAGDSGCGGKCDGHGQCTFTASGTRCDVCKVCDGSGQCNQLPSDEDGGRCGPVPCGAVGTECQQFGDGPDRRCVSLGLCAAANDPATCTRSMPAADGTPCATGVCVSGVCSAPLDGGSSGGHGGCS